MSPVVVGHLSQDRRFSGFILIIVADYRVDRMLSCDRSRKDRQ